MSIAEGLPHPTVTSIAEWEGLLWFGTFGGGLASWDGRRFGVYTTAQGLLSDDILKLRVMADGRLAVMTMRGVGWLAQGGCHERLETLGGQPVGPVYDLLEDHNSEEWLATLQHGVISTGGQRLQACSPDAGRVYCLEEEGLQIVQGADERVENAALCADRQGRLWVGQHPPGEVGWMEGGRFSPLREALAGAVGLERGLIGVDAIVQDKQGRVWFGARGDERALSCFDGRRLRVFEVAEGFVKTHYVHALALGPDGALWIGTGVGLVAYQGQRFRHYTVADGLPENAINALAFDRQGHLWIGTSGGGAVRWDGQVFQVVRLGKVALQNSVESGKGRNALQ